MSIALRLLITPPICLVMLAACGSSGNSPGDYPLGNDGSVDLTAMPRGEDGATGESAPLPSFAHDILPMLDKSCSCHALAGDPPSSTPTPTWPIAEPPACNRWRTG